jgi:hypothetical protein
VRLTTRSYYDILPSVEGGEGRERMRRVRLYIAERHSSLLLTRDARAYTWLRR